MPRHRTRSHALVLVMALLTAAAGSPDHHSPGPPLGPIGNRDVTVLNHGPSAIVELYVSPTSADSWGDDRLGDKQLDKGAKVSVALGRMRDCGFDILAIYDDASREQVNAANLCRARQVVLDGSNLTPPPPPPMPEQHVTLVNASRLPIQQLYISSPDATQWGDDLLVTAGMSVGETRPITFHGTCEADVRVVFANRAAEERRGLDLCRLPTLRIAPGWTTEDAP